MGATPDEPGTRTHAPDDQTTRRVSTEALRRLSDGATDKVAGPTPLEPQVLAQLRQSRRQGLEGQGEPFGRYLVFGAIGRGGMAEVHLAAEALAEGVRLLVLKRILPERLGSAVHRQLFLEEGRLLASLDHPGIVKLLDVGEVDGVPYLAFELIDGLSVRELQGLLGPEGLPPKAALELVAQVAAALDYAHGAQLDGRPLQIVHRDVTPQNVLLTRTGQVKLVDFGIARFATREHHTQQGVVRGKLGYMAPEQCRGGALDGRADVFALGLVAAELLTGARVLPPALIVLDDAEPLIRERCARAHWAVPVALADLLVQLTRVDPAARLFPAGLAARQFATFSEAAPGPGLAHFAAERLFPQLLPLDLSTLADHPTHRVRRPESSTLSLQGRPSEEDTDPVSYAATVRKVRIPTDPLELRPTTKVNVLDEMLRPSRRWPWALLVAGIGAAIWLLLQQ